MPEAAARGPHRRRPAGHLHVRDRSAGIACDGLFPVAMGVHLKPLRTGQTPSEYSRKKIGASAIADHRQTSSLTPNIVPRLAGRSSGAPVP